MKKIYSGIILFIVLILISNFVFATEYWEIENKKIISTIMIFEDKFWRKIGKLKVKDFVWPDQYERDLDDNNKYIIYTYENGWGEVQTKE